ncbi:MULTISPECIES: 2-phospho-L-lactate guanylyltransferase [unclassified Blastococcus]
MEWSVVVPAKRLAVAKTRLAPLTGAAAELHADLVLALLADTVTAALAAASGGTAVADVVVVTDDPRAAAVVTGLGARTVPDEPDRGLNPALAHGARAARTAAVAALSSDLPALRPAELAAALAAAEGTARGLVADAAGTGTTLLTARAGDLDPRFGAGSAAAHAAGGARPLTGDWPGLRRDVDTAADLAEAVRLGVGRHTAGVLPRLPLPAPPR